MRQFFLLITAMLLLQFAVVNSAKADENTGLNFDGANDYVVFGGPALGRTGTIECWLSLESFPANGNKLLVFNGTPGANGFGIYIINGVVNVAISGIYSFSSGFTPTLNTLTHYALTVSNTEARLYVNGSLAVERIFTTSSPAPLTPIGPLTFGQSVASECFDGTLDEVRIWSSIKSEQEIEAKFNCGMTNLNSYPADLVHYYDFSSGTPGGFNLDNVITDRIRASLNGTMINFTGNGTPISNYAVGKIFTYSPIVFVNAAATGANDGSSWNNAFTNLGEAMNFANNFYCGIPQLWIAAGTYLPTRDPFASTSPADPRDLTFLLGADLKVYGGFAGNETTIDQRVAGNVTVLSGDIGIAGDSTDNCYHVVSSFNLYDRQFLDRLVITGGNANGSGFVKFVARNNGGGMITRANSDLILSNIVFEKNTASAGGGGLYLSGRKPPFTENFPGTAQIINTIFYQNNSADQGGGMFLVGSEVQMVNTLGVSNKALEGSFVYEQATVAPDLRLNIRNSIIYNNQGAASLSGDFNFNNTSFSNVIIQDSGISIPTVSRSNPVFRNVQLPKGNDGKWMTPDDGLAAFACDAIDKGDNSYTPAGYTRDIALQTRVTDVNYAVGGSQVSPVVDIGAYESQLQVDTAQFSSVGYSHAIPFPHHRVPDSIGPVGSPPVLPGDVGIYSWQKTTDEINWSNADSINTKQFYTIPASVNATKFYRSSTNVCNNIFTSNTVKITVLVPAGRILGRVFSVRGSNAGVSGVTVYAQKTIDLPGSPITRIDSTVTVTNGNYAFNNLFYGDPNSFPYPATIFKLWAAKPRHIIGPDSLLTTPIASNADNPGYNFADSTALGISGQVVQQCDSCNDPTNGNLIRNQKAPLDSVTIYRSGLNNTNLSFVTKTGFLYGENGVYTTTVEDPGNYIIKPEFNAHVFVPVSRAVTVVEPRDSVDFIDVSTHHISGYVSACNNYIGIAELEFRDVLPNNRPSVFHKRVTTNNQGFYSVRLPARKYTVTVKSFTQLDAANNYFVSAADVLNFFNNILHTDSLTRDITNSDTTLDLDYRRPPTIVVEGLEDSCISGNGFTVLRQMVNTLFRVKVYEGTAIQGCLIRTVPGTATDSISLTTNVQTSGAPQHLRFKLDSAIIIKPGVPNIISPYLKTFQLVYPDRFNRPGASASVSKNIVVTGIKSDPGTFTTVSPQVPLMILHDPPGDGSFSTWSTNTTNETALRMFANKGNSLNTWAEVKLGVEFNAGIGYEVPTSIWASLNASLDVSSTVNTDVESIISTSSTQEVSTSSSPDIIGSPGDVFIGTAINLLYSGATEITYNGGCDVNSSRTFIVAPDSFSTQYIYTEAFITDVVIPTQLQLAQNSTNTPAATARFLNQANVWQQVIANNAANKKLAPLVTNYSFNGGATYTNTTEASSSNSNTIEFNLELNETVAGDAGLAIGGSGVSGGVTVAFKIETGNSRTSTQTNSITSSYTLADDDPYDYFSVDVKKDPVYNTPVFELVAGTSSCPPEPGTQPRDEVTLTVPNPIQAGLAENATAVYSFSVGNTSPSGEPRSYKFGFNASSNTGAASVEINGLNPTEITLNQIPYGQSRTVTVTVRLGITNVYSFEGLEFYATDICDGSVYATTPVSAFFVSPCSNITLASPANNWVRTLNSLPLVVDGYDTATLTKIDVEYSKGGSDNWVTAFTLQKNQLVANPNSTAINWDITGLTDSIYSLRVKLYCSGGVIYSERSTGVIDRKAPAVFGKPEPTDDNFVNGDVIGISYNEIIGNAGLNNNKVYMRNITDAVDIPVQVSGYENKIAIVPTVNLTALTGKTIRVIVKDISDSYGNLKSTPDTFQFTVGTVVPGTGPQLTVSISNASVQENGSDSIAVIFTLSQAATDSLRINYSVAGNAVFPGDYVVSYVNPDQPSYTNHDGVQGSLVIPKDSSNAVMKIAPVNDPYSSPIKNIVISLSAGGDYVVGSNSVVIGSIINDDPPSVYTFTGSGNFNNPANWQNNSAPPMQLQSGNQIIINPTSGNCILNIPLTILPGGSITVAPGKNFIIQGNLTIRQ